MKHKFLNTLKSSKCGRAFAYIVIAIMLIAAFAALASGFNVLAKWLTITLVLFVTFCDFTAYLFKDCKNTFFGEYKSLAKAMPYAIRILLDILVLSLLSSIMGFDDWAFYIIAAVFIILCASDIMEQSSKKNGDEEDDDDDAIPAH